MKKLNVTELSIDEQKNIDGGWMKSAFFWLLSEWDDIVEGNKQWKRENNK